MTIATKALKLRPESHSQLSLIATCLSEKIKSEKRTLVFRRFALSILPSFSDLAFYVVFKLT